VWKLTVFISASTVGVNYMQLSLNSNMAKRQKFWQTPEQPGKPGQEVVP